MLILTHACIYSLVYTNSNTHTCTHSVTNADDDDDDDDLADLMSPPDSPPPRPPKSVRAKSLQSRPDEKNTPTEALVNNPFFEAPASPPAESSAASSKTNALENNPFAEALVRSSPTRHGAGAEKVNALAVWRQLLERLESAIAAKQYVDFIC